MFEFHQTLHETYGVCLWTILSIAALVVLIVIACTFIFSDSVRTKVFNRKMKDNYHIDVFDDKDIDGGDR